MPQTRRRLEETAVRLVAPHRGEIADLIPTCDVLSRKSTCSQVSRRNLIPSGMSAPSMQLFDTWYFLFSLAHLRRAESACDPHVAGALESLESEGNSLEDIWCGQKPGSVFRHPFKMRHVHSHTRKYTLPLILSLCNIKRMRVRVLRFHKQPAILPWCTTER